MNNIISVMFFGLALLSFASCTSYPLGLTKAQWEASLPDKQADYLAQQNKIDEQRRLEYEARRKELEAKGRQEQERIANLHTSGRFGDVIVVSVDGGEIAIGEKHHSYRSVVFELAKGEGRWVDFIRTDRMDRKRQIPIRLSDDGRILYFDSQSRAQIVIFDDGWQFGKTYRPPPMKGGFDDSKARNIRIRIQYKKLPRS